MNYKLIGANIRNARKSNNITQEVLAETVNLSAVFISQIENGARKPSLETVYNISKALNISLDEIVNENNNSFEIKENLELSLLLNNCTENEIELITDLVRAVHKNIVNDKFINKHQTSI